MNDAALTMTGESDWVVLEFDHVNGKKINNIANMVQRGWALETIKNEISKCEVRCANCHRRRHYKERCLNSIGRVVDS